MFFVYPIQSTYEQNSYCRGERKSGFLYFNFFRCFLQLAMFIDEVYSPTIVNGDTILISGGQSGVFTDSLVRNDKIET